jgi:predicted component of type VI protein secretion system
MSGLCIHYDLLPLLVLVKGHALVAVSRKQYLRDTLHQPPDELQSFIRGLLQADRGSILRTLVHNKAYMALECTGFAATQALANTMPEGRGREPTSGHLAFERAVEAGREQLDLAERPFLYALDVVSLHRQQSPYGISLPYELAETERSSAPAPRSGQAAPIASRAATIQRQSLQKRLEALEQEYQAVDSQFNSTIDAGMRVRLQARLDGLSQEIQQADEALQRLDRLPEASMVTPTARNSRTQQITTQPQRTPSAESRPQGGVNAPSFRENLTNSFSESELNDLCFDLGIDYDNLAGQTKSAKARELILYIQRRGWLNQLIARCRELRPNLDWPTGG